MLNDDGDINSEERQGSNVILTAFDTFAVP
jgi:hypothetical protein